MKFRSFGFKIKNLTDYLRDDLLVDPIFVFNITTETTELKLDNPRFYHLLKNVKVGN